MNSPGEMYEGLDMLKQEMLLRTTAFLTFAPLFLPYCWSRLDSTLSPAALTRSDLLNSDALLHIIQAVSQ